MLVQYLKINQGNLPFQQTKEGKKNQHKSTDMEQTFDQIQLIHDKNSEKQE